EDKRYFEGMPEGESYKSNLCTKISVNIRQAKYHNRSDPSSKVFSRALPKDKNLTIKQQGWNRLGQLSRESKQQLNL
ncbi:4173_t:CDS:1, partial [Ambispora leptoticha]